MEFTLDFLSQTTDKNFHPYINGKAAIPLNHITTTNIRKATMETSLDSITVDKLKLIITLTENKTTHNNIFVKSQKGYKKAVIKTLENKLKEAKDGKDVNLSMNLDKPTDHTSDYTTVIGMLDWCLEDQVKLTRANYENYVLDQWSWSRNFAMTSGLYCGD